MTTTILKQTSGQPTQIFFVANMTYCCNMNVEQKFLQDLQRRNELFKIDPIVLIDAGYWKFAGLMDNAGISNYYSFGCDNNKILTHSIIQTQHEQKN